MNFLSKKLFSYYTKHNFITETKFTPNKKKLHFEFLTPDSQFGTEFGLFVNQIT